MTLVTLHDNKRVICHDIGYFTVQQTGYMSIHWLLYRTTNESYVMTLVTLQDNKRVVCHDIGYFTVQQTGYMSIHWLLYRTANELYIMTLVTLRSNKRVVCHGLYVNTLVIYIGYFTVQQTGYMSIHWLLYRTTNESYVMTLVTLQDNKRVICHDIGYFTGQQTSYMS